ncbi:transporter substrate-binding domain-containing protein [Thalassospira sp.]|uniref:transporter substrate-binding domain-containing protein n=1 Tax=Thalassospira sp. TaxID=1912094 RepID=UPI000C54A7C6|nr:transporter substrate-binding domain-containing protein [Thalassospira sp.]MBC06114.1 ABC transporter substrate-binding protein [Thalassospira sp.]|tara:strand:+ start:7442 stop:8266 length:825 start_codon:yes stop_codon:yes gene_type:complete
MTKFGKLAVSAVALASAVAANSAVADTLEDVIARDTLIVGVKNDYPPYGYLNDAGETVGFEVELAKYVAKELLGSPDKIELVPVVAANRIQFLEAGRVDVIFATLGVTDQRDEVIDFTVHYVSAAGPSVLMPEATTVNSWEQLKGQPICGIQGSYYNKKMTEEFGINLVNFKNQADAYRALKDNRCIGFVFDDMTLQKKLEEADWSEYKIAVAPYEFLPMAGGLREDDAAFAEAVNNAIVKAEGEGKLIEWETEFGMPHSDYIAKRAEAAAAQN